jgi:hypothetical protein
MLGSSFQAVLRSKHGLGCQGKVGERNASAPTEISFEVKTKRINRGMDNVRHAYAAASVNNQRIGLCEIEVDNDVFWELKGRCSLDVRLLMFRKARTIEFQGLGDKAETSGETMTGADICGER